MVFVKIEGMLFFIVTFHQIVFYSLCFGRSWLLIHLMLKLIYVNVEYFTNFCIVSIHPMLKFINLPLLIWRQTANISIHPMLKLIDMQDNLRGQITEHFNTSHVKVNLYKELEEAFRSRFQYIPC